MRTIRIAKLENYTCVSRFILFMRRRAGPGPNPVRLPRKFLYSDPVQPPNPVNLQLFGLMLSPSWLLWLLLNQFAWLVRTVLACLISIFRLWLACSKFKSLKQDSARCFRR